MFCLFCLLCLLCFLCCLLRQTDRQTQMGTIESFFEGIAQDFAVDTATDKVNEYAEKHVKTKDPYRGPDGKKLKLRDNATKEEQKEWKWIQKRAWHDDKCFMGCYPVDCGIGWGPIVVAIPCVGPILMYLVHTRLVARAALRFHLDAKTVAKLNANILFDLILTFPPVIGSLFAWMSGCSTRNAAIIHTEITKMLIQRERASQYNNQYNQYHNELQTVETGQPVTVPNVRPGPPTRVSVPYQAPPPPDRIYNSQERNYRRVV